MPGRIDDELDGAGADVADRAAERDRGLAHRGAARVVERGRRRLLDDLLVAALDRALALPQVHDVAVRVAEDLDLDVARPLDVALEQQRVVAERDSRLAARALDRLGELARRARTTRMPLPPPPADALTSSGKPMLARCVDAARSGRRRGSRAPPARRRSARCAWRPACCRAARITLRRRPDEHEARLGDRLGERGVLGRGSRSRDGSRRRRCARAASRIAWITRYDSRAGGGPIRTASSANRTNGASASASEYTATVAMPIARHVRITRSAISPRFATRTLSMARTIGGRVVLSRALLMTCRWCSSLR